MSAHQNSRLGQLLLARKLITPVQLEAAIHAQRGSGLRLGEQLIAQGLLSEAQLKKALRKQSNLRLAATMVAALLAPFQMASADIQRLPTHSYSQQIDKGLVPMSDEELGDVSAQGLDTALQGLFLSAESGDGVGVIQQLSKLVMPALDALDAETTLRDVQYDTRQLTSTLNADGSINVRLPSSIGEMRFDNIRVKGADASQSFGSLSLHDIDLSQASLKISLR